MVAALLATGILWGRAAVAEDPAGPLRVVFHVNVGDVEAQKKAIKNVANFLKEEPAAEVEVVCHGAGIGLVTADRCPDAEGVGALAGRGVRFVACENTMREQGIGRDRLLRGVVTVPSGTAEVVRKQHAGFAYFKP
jgi:intracellular sulfur oxidation DsrE/DsrF family protein